VTIPGNHDDEDQFHGHSRRAQHELFPFSEIISSHDTCLTQRRHFLLLYAEDKYGYAEDKYASRQKKKKKKKKK
jgi:hypothetical protein